MKKMEKIFNSTVAVVATFFTYLFGGWDVAIRTLVCYFYIANEGISLLENVSNLGVKIPDKLKDALVQLNKDESEEE